MLALGFGFDLAINAPRQPLGALVPDLTGTTAADAQDRLHDAGLFGQHPRTGSCGHVVEQHPAPGAPVSLGSVVTFDVRCTDT